MKELKDIVLKKGDIVYLDDETTLVISDGFIGESIKYFEDFDCKIRMFPRKITKIERPVKYETIYEATKQILDKEEKEYLENVIRPFRNKIKYIKKRELGFGWDILIRLNSKDCNGACLPRFESDTMYKGMEVDKEYTLKELGLFE